MIWANPLTFGHEASFCILVDKLHNLIFTRRAITGLDVELGDALVVVDHKQSLSVELDARWASFLPFFLSENLLAVNKDKESLLGLVNLLDELQLVSLVH